MTPIERPEELGKKEFLTDDQAAELEEQRLKAALIALLQRATRVLISMRCEFPSRTFAALPYRRGRLSVEHRVNRRLGAFLSVRTGHAHRAYDLAIDHDGKRARLWGVAH